MRTARAAAIPRQSARWPENWTCHWRALVAGNQERQQSAPAARLEQPTRRQNGRGWRRPSPCAAKATAAAALAVVRTDRGRELMDRVRAVTAEMLTEERRTLSTRQADWLGAARTSSFVTLGGAALLLVFIIAAGLRASRDYRARQIQGWIRIGQMGLSEKVQGEQRLEKLAEGVLVFLAEYLDAQTGAVYLAEGAIRN